MELLGKVFGMKREDTTIAFKRALFMNFEDYVRIQNTIASAPDESHIFYDIRFGVMDFELYKKEIFQFSKISDAMLGEMTYENFLALVKKFFPEFMGGKPLDKSDIYNLYANPLGLKCVPPEEGVVDKEGAFESLITKYYFPDSDEVEHLGDLLNYVGICTFSAPFPFCTISNIGAFFPLSSDQYMFLDFSNCYDDNWPEHKNAITYYRDK